MNNHKEEERSRCVSCQPEVIGPDGGFVNLSPKVPRAHGAPSYSRYGSRAKSDCIPQRLLEVQPLSSRITAAGHHLQVNSVSVFELPARSCPPRPCRTQSILVGTHSVWVLPLPPGPALSSDKQLKLFAVFLSLNENLLYLSPTLWD